MVVRETDWCAPTLADAKCVRIAVKNGDTQGLLGLMAGKKAFPVDGGTRLDVWANLFAMAYATIESGPQISKPCFIPMSRLYLQAASASGKGEK
jgi:hypothetical protein